MLSQIKKLFSDVPLLVVENKVDLKKTNSSHLKISCKNGDGIDKLTSETFRMIKT